LQAFSNFRIIEITVFWVIILWGIISLFWHFNGTCCLHLTGKWIRFKQIQQVNKRRKWIDYIDQFHFPKWYKGLIMFSKAVKHPHEPKSVTLKIQAACSMKCQNQCMIPHSLITQKTDIWTPPVTEPCVCLSD